MIILDDLKQKTLAMKEDVDKIKSALDIDGVERKLKELEEIQLEEDFFQRDDASGIYKKVSNLNDILESFKRLNSEYEDTLCFLDLVGEENDESLLEEAEQTVLKCEKSIREMTVNTLLTGQ